MDIINDPVCGINNHVHEWILQQLSSSTIVSSALQRQLVESTGSTLDFATLAPCYISDGPRDSFDTNRCGTTSTVVAYNPLQIEQRCNTSIIPPRQFQIVQLPCEIPGPITSNNQQKQRIEFDPVTGMMVHPIKEQWMVWKVRRGGAYLFFPDTMVSFLNDIRNPEDDPIIIEQGGFVVKTKSWKRTIIQKEIPQLSSTKGSEINVISFDFLYETFLQIDNNEWLVRYSTANPIESKGIFYTDLNGLIL